MKAFLLAAGEGRRLQPVTNTTPKCIVPIGDTNLLAIWLLLLEMHGVREVLVNVHHLYEPVLEFLHSCQTPLSIVTIHEQRLLGSAGTVVSNRQFVSGDDDFFIAYADNLTNADLGEMLRFHRGHDGPMTVGIVPADRPQEKGIVETDRDGLITNFEEKPASPRSNMANAGIYVASQSLFSCLPSSVADDEILDFGFHVLPKMVGQVYGFQIHGFLKDIGTPDGYRQAREQWPGL